MLSLTYLSTATQPFAAADLAALLAHSRAANHRRGLTGMLLYAEGHFVQTLEGEPDAVADRFAVISGDPRHRDVIVALREEIEERVFPEWSMGFDEVTGADAAELAGYSGFLRPEGPDQDPAEQLGRAGVFHRIFRDRMRGDVLPGRRAEI